LRRNIYIDGRVIGADRSPYIIAELSANHNGDINKAFEIIHMAKDSGADAVKIQTYRPDTITLRSDKSDFRIKDGLWGGRTLYDLYEEAHTPWEWHKPLFEYAHKQGITLFSSPFDNTAVDLLEDLNAPAYKIASFELVDIPLIKYAASTKKPLIMSTGMADEEEIQEAIDVAREAGCEQIALLHCVSAYPAKHEDYNLRTINDMQQRFGCLVGLSDHTINNVMAIASVAMGASIIEKHVTMDRSGGGADDSFSIEPEELSSLCRDAGVAWEALGSVDYKQKEGEKNNLVFRRSIYAIKDIKSGDVITNDNVRSIRPGYGLKPKYYFDLIGRKVCRDIESGTAIHWDMII